MHATEADLTKRSEAQRREAKRTEARLMSGLHDIEEARLYHVNTMIKEQRRIQRDLMRVKQGDGVAQNKGIKLKVSISIRYSKTKMISNSRNLFPGNERDRSLVFNRVMLPTIPIGKDQKHIMEPDAHRAKKLFPMKMSRLAIQPGISVALQMRVNDFIDGDNSKKGSQVTQAMAEPDRSFTPSGIRKVKAEASIADINMSNVKYSIAKRLSISGKPKGQEATEKKEASSVDSKTAANEDEAIVSSSETTPKPGQLSVLAENSALNLEAFTPDGFLRTMYTIPSFQEAFQEAKKARYIRHRGIPESEKALSINEIFGRNPSSAQDQATEEGNAETEGN
ncbi:coiled-coil domain-containing protein 190 [Latimeria chalumnae]|uniref:coiled-coil domain-containing protein 190 n=1 Tax=Latimeria chalumnae TaxID=7897 RepID=UPI00313B2115